MFLKKKQHTHHIQFKWVIFYWLLIGGLVGYLFYQPIWAQTAKVAYVQGEATIGRNKPVTADLVVKAGNTIRTGADARVLLQFSDGSTLLMKPNTQIKIVEARKRRNGISLLVDLVAGELDNVVAPQTDPSTNYRIRTRSALTGVKGTIFRVTANNNGRETITEVLEGTVNFRRRRDGRVLPLTAGQGSIVGPKIKKIQAVSLLGAPELINFSPIQYRSTVHLQIVPLEEAEQYRLEISRTSTFEAVVYETLSDKPSTTIANFDDGQFYLRISGISSEGFEGLHSVAAFEVTDKPEPPFIVAPLNEANLRAQNVQFQWTRGFDVSGYRLQIAKDAEFNDLLIDKQIIENHFALPLEAGQYFWRVSTVRHEQTGPYGNISTFNLISPNVTDIAILKPSDGKYTISWASKGAMGYEFQIATDPHFRNIIKAAQLEDAQIAVQFDEPGKYYLRVRSLGNDGSEGPYSEIQQIEYWRDFPWWILPIIAVGL